MFEQPAIELLPFSYLHGHYYLCWKCAKYLDRECSISRVFRTTNFVLNLCRTMQTVWCDGPIHLFREISKSSRCKLHTNFSSGGSSKKYSMQADPADLVPFKIGIFSTIKLSYDIEKKNRFISFPVLLIKRKL